MKNIDSFTDEQLLNLVNNYIDKNTKFDISEFTGGYVSVTINANKKQDTCKVALLFGYKNRNSQSVIFEIDENLIFIWIKAIKLKIASFKLDNTGMDFNEINGLMNTSYELRTKTHCTLPYLIPNTNYHLPITDDELKDLKSFIDLKHLMTNKNKDENGKQFIYEFERQEVSISDSGRVYFRASQADLSATQSDKFYKDIFKTLQNSRTQEKR